MDGRKISEILTILRTEKRLVQDKLCLGLCTKSTYSKYERGERIPDRLLLNAMLQRMGKNPDKLETMLTAEEYDYFCWKKKVITAVIDEDIVALQKLLEEPTAIDIIINENLQQQFLYQMQVVVESRTEGNVERCIRLLEQAVEFTMPEIKIYEMEHYLISVEEMELLLRLMDFYIRGKHEKEAVTILARIVGYIDKYYDDNEIKLKIYPKAVKLLVPFLLEEQKQLEAMLLCEKAIKLLCWQGVLFDLVDLLEWYLKCSKGIGRTEQVIRYEKQLWALKEVYKEYGIDKNQMGNSLQSYSNQERYLVDEVIKKCRVEKAMSQEVLSEGICTPETLSRIESGNRGPNTRNFRALMEKLETGLDYYNGGLDTNDFLLLEKKLELDRAISLSKWEEAHQMLNVLKEQLDMSRPQNKRIIQADENCILFNEGKLGLKEFLKSCEQAIGCENEKWRTEAFWNQFFTGYKVRIMNFIACIYRVDNQHDNAIFILEHVLEQLVNSKVELEDRSRSSMLVIGNLSSWYGASGQLEKCIETCEAGIKLCIKCGRAMSLGEFFGNKAEAMNEKAGSATEKSRHYLRWAYYISDLIEARSTTAYTDTYYRSQYESDAVWY